MIVEDQPTPAEVLEGYLREMPFLEVVGICRSAFDTLDFLRHQEADLLIMDIELPDLDGIDLVRSLQGNYHYIFVTGYKKYAVKGFEVDAVDYILKPVTFKRLTAAIYKYIRKVRREDILSSDNTHPEGVAADKLEASSKVEYFVVRDNHQYINVSLSDIIYIKGLRDYIQIFLRENNYIHKMYISAAERFLSKEGFLRIHKSYLVNKLYVKKIYPTSVILTNNDKLPLGKNYWPEISHRLKNSTL
ncbi:MAG TPA: LytTR family DNA-binding domain-containing protein [Anseongella sp.]